MATLCRPLPPTPYTVLFHSQRIADHDDSSYGVKRREWLSCVHPCSWFSSRLFCSLCPCPSLLLTASSSSSSSITFCVECDHSTAEPLLTQMLMDKRSKWLRQRSTCFILSAAWAGWQSPHVTLLQITATVEKHWRLQNQSQSRAELTVHACSTETERRDHIGHMKS